jgi:hypothetical protein
MNQRTLRRVAASRRIDERLGRTESPSKRPGFHAKNTTTGTMTAACRRPRRAGMNMGAGKG